MLMTLDCAKKMLGEKTTSELIALENMLRANPTLTKNCGRLLLAIAVLLNSGECKEDNA